MCVTGHMIPLSQFIRCRFKKLLDVLIRLFSFNWTLDILLLISEALIESFLLVWDDYSVCLTMSQRSNAGCSSVIQYQVI